MLKISSYNINGVRAAHRKGFIDWVNHSNPDIICIQELRTSSIINISYLQQRRDILEFRFLVKKKLYL